MDDSRSLPDTLEPMWTTLPAAQVVLLLRERTVVVEGNSTVPALVSHLRR